MTGPIGVNPALLGLSSAIETAGAAAMAGVTGSAAPTMTMVLPPGADPTSAAAAAGLNARGAAALAVMADLTTVRALFAQTVGVNGVSYAAVDAINQASLAL
jgi:PE family